MLSSFPLLVRGFPVVPGTNFPQGGGWLCLEALPPSPLLCYDPWYTFTLIKKLCKKTVWLVMLRVSYLEQTIIPLSMLDGERERIWIYQVSPVIRHPVWNLLLDFVSICIFCKISLSYCVCVTFKHYNRLFCIAGEGTLYSYYFRTNFWFNLPSPRPQFLNFNLRIA